jgi:hypothetical protein
MMKTRQKKAAPIIGAHLDMKGVIFRPSYIPQLMADFASQGVNTVLVEYEDIFPFEGMDIAFDRKTVWSRGTLAQFQREAKRHGIGVIPLQQCLGHLDYLFRWRQYRRFAENPKYPCTLCLSQPAGRELVAAMLRQVIEAHPDSRYVHLGMDEAHGLASCPKCRAKGDVLTVFLDYLRGLCDLCDGYGVTPVIWSDMLEDHFRPDVFADIRDRVVLMSWDYAKHGATDYLSRVGGWRVSRAWLGEPENPDAPAVAPGQKFLEDLPADIRRAVAPFRRGRGFVPLYPADLWTRLGFRVIGACAVRFSAMRAVMPDSNALRSNIGAWVDAVRRTRQLGLVATSWARGGTYAPPNFSIDLTWPDIAFMSRAMGGRPAAFWPGIDPKKADLIVRQLGRSRQDWRLEGHLAGEMEALAPKVKRHRYEWESWMLMARVLEWQRRAEYAQAEADYMDSGARPVEPEWQRRLDDQKGILRDLEGLKKRVRQHFGARYYGEGFEEWMRELFDLHERRVRESRAVSMEKLAQVRRTYSR